MPIQIAVSDDIPELVELLCCLFEQEAEFRPNPEAHARGLAKIIDDPLMGSILLAREEGQAIGMVNLLYSVSTALGARVALLEDMVVHPAFRNAGIGSKLLQSAIDHARAVGCQRITLLTDADNFPAQSFYERHGFSLSSMRPMRLSLSK